MHRLIRFYNQNRKSIWKIILVITIIICILQLLNYIAKKQNEKVIQDVDNNESINTIKYNNVNLETEKSVLSGDKISKEQQSSVKIIDDFFSYCNEQKIQEAYDLLTEECKEEIYSSVQIFEEMYYKKVLNGQRKNISIENWTDDIYKVKINNDFLSSGKYSTENTIQDYITIKNNKLNINSYIGRKTYDKEKYSKDINIKVLEKNEYMDYTTYTFEITNNSKNTVLLDTLKNIDSMYIEDNNGVKYSAYTHEISEGQLLIYEGSKVKIKLKYYSKFSSNKKIKKIVFSNMVLNYDNFSNNNCYDFTIEL